MRQYVCEALEEHCIRLNDAHKDKEKHEIMKNTIPYQRYIGAMEELNVVSREYGCGCQCIEVFKKGKPHSEHIGHRMVRR